MSLGGAFRVRKIATGDGIGGYEIINFAAPAAGFLDIPFACRSIAHPGEFI
jgi:hypothetical protein